MPYIIKKKSRLPPAPLHKQPIHQPIHQPLNEEFPPRPNRPYTNFENTTHNNSRLDSISEALELGSLPTVNYPHCLLSARIIIGRINTSTRCSYKYTLK